MTLGGGRGGQFRCRALKIAVFRTGRAVGACMPPTELPVLLLRSSCAQAGHYPDGGDQPAFVDWPMGGPRR